MAADFIKTQNSFADGEVSKDFFTKDNLNGLSKLENMDVISGGGLRRRRGLETVTSISGSARLIPFSVNGVAIAVPTPLNNSSFISSPHN